MPQETADRMDLDGGPGEQGRRGRGRPRGCGDCRDRLLEAASSVFIELGYERATLQDIVDRAGVSKGALYHYFDSKDRLFLELMRERLKATCAAGQALVAAAEPTKSREALLRELLQAMWANMQQPGMLELTRLMMTELPKFPEVGRAVFDEIVAPARETTRQIWDREGPATCGRHALIDTIVALLPSMMLGVTLTQHAFRDIDPAGTGTAQAGTVVVDLLLRGALASVEAVESGTMPRPKTSRQT